MVLSPSPFAPAGGCTHPCLAVFSLGFRVPLTCAHFQSPAGSPADSCVLRGGGPGRAGAAPVSSGCFHQRLAFEFTLTLSQTRRLRKD